MKSIGGGFAPAILNGPLGWGKEAYPFKRHIYSPESGEDTTSWHTLSDIDEGSNLMLKNDSVPSKLSDGWTTTVDVSSTKSTLATGSLAFGSTLTGAFSPTF